MGTRNFRSAAAMLLVAGVAACEVPLPLEVEPIDSSGTLERFISPTVFTATPIHELTTTYFGLPGYYYDGSNTPPVEHSELGTVQAMAIEPLGTDGTPLPAAEGGRIVFLSMGFSNTNGKWCKRKSLDGVTCNSWSFMGRWRTNGQMRQPTDGVQLFNGTTNGGTSLQWDDPADPQYEKVAVNLATQGLSPLQVQIMYVEIVMPAPTISLPDSNADMYQLVVAAGNQMRAMKVRYPNLRQVFVSPRDYAGYAKVPSNPEPYAYETAFAVKRLIQAQITQLETGLTDSLAGDLSLASAPWLTWGPYLWATATPRADGLFWTVSHYDPTDGIHFNKSGEIKAANWMISWFSNSPFSQCWLLRGYRCSSTGPAPPQFARPVSLIGNSGWRATSGTALWDMLDESIADESGTVVATPLPPALSPGNSMTVGLSPVTDPLSSTEHVIQIRARKPSSGVRIDGTVELIEGTTVIATMSIANLATSTWTDYNYALTPAEADAISDYTALQLRITFWRTGTGTNRIGTVTQASLQVPGP